MRYQISWGETLTHARMLWRRNMSMSKWKKDMITLFIHLHSSSVKFIKIKYLIDIMNELVHLSEPWICILITEICPHGPHNMICSCYICLKKRKQLIKQLSYPYCHRNFRRKQNSSLFIKKPINTNCKILPVPVQQLQSHWLALEHYSQIGEHHPSVKTFMLIYYICMTKK